MTGRSMLAVAAAVGAVFALGLATLAIGIVAALGGALTGGGCAGDGGPGGGSQQVGPREWSAEQMTNAQTIVNAAVELGLPRRTAVIAVATAIVESRLENLDVAVDHDSLGLFQQRPSQGWGTPAQILNPATARRSFYERLVALTRWPTLPLGVAAQQVQRSAHPDRYAPQESAAADLVARFWMGPDNPTHPPPAGDTRTRVTLAAATGCPDQGGSDLPVEDVALPDGFALPSDLTQRRVVAFALAQVGKPYVWGARGPDAFDCSGLTAAAWAVGGAAISGGTVNQIHDGTAVPGLAQAQPGDLLFTAGSLGTPTNPRHVGIYIGHALVVDAHSSRTGVMLSRLDRWAGEVVAIRHIAGPASSPAVGAAA